MEKSYTRIGMKLHLDSGQSVAAPADVTVTVEQWGDRAGECICLGVLGRHGSTAEVLLDPSERDALVALLTDTEHPTSATLRNVPTRRPA